jgi:hypothetical protein
MRLWPFLCMFGHVLGMWGHAAAAAAAAAAAMLRCCSGNQSTGCAATLVKLVWPTQDDDQPSVLRHCPRAALLVEVTQLLPADAAATECAGRLCEALLQLHVCLMDVHQCSAFFCYDAEGSLLLIVKC